MSTGTDIELARIRAAHKGARPSVIENPSWARAEMDVGLLLTEVERLRADVYALRTGDRATVRRYLVIDRTAYEDMIAERAQLRADDERMRCALTDVIGSCDTCRGHGIDIITLDRCQSCAPIRAALGSEEAGR